MVPVPQYAFFSVQLPWKKIKNTRRNMSRKTVFNDFLHEGQNRLNFHVEFFFYGNISPRLRNSWVNFKFRQCICSDAPSTKQVLSISSQTASRRWLKACSRFCLRMAVSSGQEAFFHFFWDGCCICSRQHYSSAFFDPLISSYPHSFLIKDCHLGFDFHSHYCWCSVSCESHHYVNFSVWIAGKDVKRMNFSSLSPCEKLHDLQFYRTIIGGNRQFK